MIKLATVFSGIGAIEHALDRMGLQHQIVFACDNGDVDILNKEVPVNIDDVGAELVHLQKTISRIGLDAEVEDLIAQRQAARKSKNWAEADRIRDLLKDMGIAIEDTREGIRWKRV